MPMMTRAALNGVKKVPAMTMKTWRRAEQLTRGVTRIVMRRSCRLSMVRAAWMAGTLQPLPMMRGMKLFPWRPMTCMSRSMMKAARAM